jgi:hypothetical protein
MSQKNVFRVTTPLGYRVVLTRNRWREMVRFKHPAVATHRREVRECLRSPDVVRSSTKDAGVHVYYLDMADKYLCVVVAPGELSNQDRFVVTASFTKRVKQGEDIWAR